MSARIRLFSRLRQVARGFALLIVVFAMVHPGPGSSAYAAEFDLRGPSLELRQTQPCAVCGETLVVTPVPAGARIQCPVCGTVQRRLGSKAVTTRVYQVCPSCNARLDVSRNAPGERVRCGRCGQAQTVLRAASRLAQPPIPEPDPAPVSDPEAPEPVRAMAPAAPPGLDGREEALPPAGLRFDSRPPPPLSTRPVRIPGIPAETGYAARPAPAAIETTPALPIGEEESGTAFQTIAVVNGTPLSGEEYEAAVASLLESARLRLGSAADSPRGREELARNETRIRQRLLQSLIDRELVLQEAEAEGVVPDLATVYERAEQLRREGRLPLPAKLLLERARAEIVLETMLRRNAPPRDATPGEVRRYYEAHREQFLQPPRAALRTLVLYFDRADGRDGRSAVMLAREVEQLLEHGQPFDEVVRSLSDGPFAERGGRFRQSGSALVPIATLAGEVRAGLGRARVGDVLGPIRLASAVVFVRVEDLRPSEPLPFSRVSGAIRDRLRREKQEQALQGWVEALRRRAEIRVLLPEALEETGPS